MTGQVATRSESVSGRGTAALLHPRPVYLVTTCDAGGGSQNASAVAWVTPLSHDPPMLGLSIRPASRTHVLILEARQFVVNAVDESMRSHVRVCGNTSGWDEVKIPSLSLPTILSDQVAPPRLAGALAWLECQVTDTKRAGDHVLHIARIVRAERRVGDVGEPERDVLLCADHDVFGRFIGLENDRLQPDRL